MSYFQGELLVQKTDSLSVGAFTLPLSSTGDIVLVEGRDKLIIQLMRALINEKTKDSLINFNSGSGYARIIKALITSTLRGMRSDQISETNRIDTDILGYGLKVYKYTGTVYTYASVTDNPIRTKYTITELDNAKTYDFAITKVYSEYESNIVDKISVTPSAFASKQNPVIGQYFVAIPGNKQITFYVDSVRDFKQSELLEEIVSTYVYQDADEPRLFVADVKVKSLDDNEIRLSTRKAKL